MCVESERKREERGLTMRKIKACIYTVRSYDKKDKVKWSKVFLIPVPKKEAIFMQGGTQKYNDNKCMKREPLTDKINSRTRTKTERMRRKRVEQQRGKGKKARIKKQEGKGGKERKTHIHTHKRTSVY